MLLRYACQPKGSASPVTPLGVELNPDVGFDVPANWAVLRCAVAASALSFTSQLSPTCTLAVPNTINATLSPGTYRFTVTIANYSAGVGTLLAYLDGTTYTTTFPATNANGVYTADVVVTAQTLTQSMQLKSGSGNTFNVTDCSVKRIA